MAQYVCGWDGGGSKTAVLILDEEGKTVLQDSFGPLNPNGNEPARIERTISDAMAMMASLPGGLDACRALVVGMAGISNVDATRMVRHCIESHGYQGRLQLVGDQEIALAGAVKGPGAVLISGTGAICYGSDAAGHSARVGGFGHVVDDGGSGYALGRDILSAVLRASDGREAPTTLTKAVYEQLRVSGVPELIAWIYQPGRGKKEIASLAPLLLPALERQDAAAIRIAEKAAADLAELAITAFRVLGLSSGELALSGSILTVYPFIRARVEALVRQAHPGVQVRAPRSDAVHGAAWLARKLA